MAYDVKKVTKLGHLRQLMDKSRQELASKTALEELAEQVEEIAAGGGETNVITTVKVNGAALEIADKAVDIPVPGKVSQLDNDSGFQTEAQVRAVVAAGEHLSRKKVDSAADIDPAAAGADRFIYMVPKDGAGDGDKYDEYMVIDGAVEMVGDWAVNLSGYVQKEEGKGLSSNDYTDEDKAKVDSLSAKSGFPSGGIIIWSGASDAVPSGWALCDGANGTPDLRDRFVVGAGSTYAVGATGGEAAHKLTISEIPPHDHGLRGYAAAATLYNYNQDDPPVYINDDNPPRGCLTDMKGGFDAHNNLPPYYALCYIMKL